ncbi:hypothetical protein [Luteimonas huabeiensis]|uniref:hypothetical protein n=1 Tax=Luteimonas huabeiensis TaxID=1244513 RepID=UPI0009DE96B2|nr:hypothetical protein [Luteimonas huabeiensis]
MDPHYPEHIERLEEALNTVVTKPSAATPPFEVAIWALEGRLDTFRAEAHEELKAAEASGDPAAIEKARQKQLLMGRARSGGLYSLNEIEEHFKARRKEF